MSKALAVINEHQFGNFNMFTREREVKTEEITNEDMAKMEKEQIDADMNEFFGISGGLEEMIYLYQEQINELTEKSKEEVIKVEELKAEEEDPYHKKEFEQQNHVFILKAEDNKERQKDSTMTIPKSPEYVVEAEIVHPGGSIRTSSGYQTSSGYKNNSQPSYTNTGQSQPSSYGATGQTSSTNKTQQQNVTSPDIMQHAGRIMFNVQESAMRTKGWGPDTNTQQSSGWNSFGKKTWKHKVRDFFQGKKVRTMIKVGALMAMQLGMAFVGKKYEYEGIGQATAFLGLMMGTFFLTKELQVEGMDPRGLGILY